MLNLWNINTIGGVRHRIVGPFFLALTPLLLFIRPLSRRLIWLVLIGLSQAAVVTFTFGAYARYAMLGLALAGLGAAAAWWTLIRLGPWPRRLAAGALILGWAMLLPESFYFLSHEMPVALGFSSREAFLDKNNQGAMEVYRWANQHLPPGAKVLVVAEHRPYFLDREFIQGSPRRNPFLPAEVFKSAADFDRAVRALGATHALINFQESDNAWEFERAAGLRQHYAAVKKWAETRLEPLFIKGQLGLYRLKRDEGHD